MKGIIKEELNVRDVIFRENEEELVEYSAQANFKVLGKVLGRDMKAAAEKIKALSKEDIQSLMGNATLALDLGSRTFDLTIEGVNVIRNEKENLKVLNQDSLTVALDSKLTEELIQEGIVRDMVRSVQNLRKEKGLEVTDRIKLFVHGTESLKQAVENFEEHLTSEVLAVSWEWNKKDDSEEVQCGEEKCLISLLKS